ncbi:MAG TPA: hypothetical protein VKD90_12320 [Gemmataceae bacterium]|nr:hypothetical protein [Gemmataceae bacterium]
MTTSESTPPVPPRLGSAYPTGSPAGGDGRPDRSAFPTPVVAAGATDQYRREQLRRALAALQARRPDPRGRPRPTSDPDG